jgi:hypothetical protein
MKEVTSLMAAAKLLRDSFLRLLQNVILSLLMLTALSSRLANTIQILRRADKEMTLRGGDR